MSSSHDEKIIPLILFNHSFEAVSVIDSVKSATFSHHSGCSQTSLNIFSKVLPTFSQNKCQKSPTTQER
jgi:hypothetical protein